MLSVRSVDGLKLKAQVEKGNLKNYLRLVEQRVRAREDGWLKDE